MFYRIILALTILTQTFIPGQDKNSVKDASLNEIINLCRGYDYDVSNFPQSLFLKTIDEKYMEFIDSISPNPKNFIFEFDTTETSISEDFTIYGFMPAWNHTDTILLNPAAIDRIGFFALKPDSILQDYFVENVMFWDAPNYKELLQARGVKIDLTIFDYNNKNISKSLFNSNNWKKLVDGIIRLVSKFNGDGVTIGFWGLENEMRIRFQEFVTELSYRLRSVIPNAKINLMLPPARTFSEKYKEYNFEMLNEYVDNYLLFGFEYPGDYKNGIGPAAPLLEGSSYSGRSISSSLDLCSCEKINLEKVIPVLPFYGLRWDYVKSENSLIRSFYNTGSNEKYRKLFDENSATSCYLSQSADSIKIIWVDDSLAQDAKYNFIKEHRLKGLGLWSLPDLTKKDWSNISNSFSAPYIDILGFSLGRTSIYFDSVFILYFILFVAGLLSVFNCPVRTFINQHIYLFFASLFALYFLMFLILYFTDQLKAYSYMLIYIFILTLIVLAVKKIADRYKEMNNP